MIPFYLFAATRIRVPPLATREFVAHVHRSPTRRRAIFPFLHYGSSLLCRYHLNVCIYFLTRVVRLNPREREVSFFVYGARVRHRAVVVRPSSPNQVKCVCVLKDAFCRVPRFLLRKRKANNVVGGREVAKVRLFRPLLHLRRNFNDLKVGVNLLRVLVGSFPNGVINANVRRVCFRYQIRPTCVRRSREVGVVLRPTLQRDKARRCRR